MPQRVGTNASLAADQGLDPQFCVLQESKDSQSLDLDPEKPLCTSRGSKNNNKKIFRYS